MATPYILTPTALTVVLDFQPTAVPLTHPNYAHIVEALQRGADEGELRPLIDVGEAIVTFMEDAVEIRDRVLYYRGNVLDTGLTRRIVDFMSSGQEGLAQPLIRFFEKVMQNPSRRAVQGLYDWIEVGQMPIHPDGDILAYKIVKDDYHDYHSGRFDHSVGNVVEEPRNFCDEDPEVTCSNGLHFCSAGYLPQYHQGDATRRIVMVKINPADVVAFPKDAGISKGRCCRLEVIGEIPKERIDDFVPSLKVWEPSFEDDAAEAEQKEFKVGQVWRDRDGDEWTITDVDRSSNYQIAAELVNDSGVAEIFTSGGYTYSDERESGSDLIELVRDVEPEPEPEPEPVPSDLPLRIGQRWRTRDGVEVTVERFESYDQSVARLSDDRMVWVDNGHCNKNILVENPQDLVERLPDQPAPAPDFDLKVGQVWKQRDGKHVAMVGPNPENGWLMAEDGYYRKIGTGECFSYESDEDLVELVSNP